MHELSAHEFEFEFEVVVFEFDEEQPISVNGGLNAFLPLLTDQKFDPQ